MFALNSRPHHSMSGKKCDSKIQQKQSSSKIAEYSVSNYMSELYLSDVSSVDSATDDENGGTNNNDQTHDHDGEHHHHEDLDTTWEDFDITEDQDAATNQIPSVESGNTEIESESTIQQESHPIKHRWNYYYHLLDDKSWTLESYKFIMQDIDSVESLIGVNEMVTDHIIKNCMLFVMKSGITPMWEDKQNREGGCFSYKVVNKTVTSVWRKLMYLLCCNSLTVDPKHNDLVNGITISPKRGFCIVKIWMKTCKLQDPAIIVNIDGLIKNGCLFKAHSPEF